MTDDIHAAAERVRRVSPARWNKGKKFREIHGMSGTRVYEIWAGMIKRCENRKYKDFANYGGRGITVCAQWRQSFMAFYQDMGEPPTESHSLDRIDVNGNYEPGNCKWSTFVEQSQNMRSNRMLSFNGMTMPMAKWASHIGLSNKALHHRLSHGWSVERALTTPKTK